MTLREFLSAPGRASELARKTGIRPAHLSQIVNGACRPSPKIAERIEAASGGVVSKIDLVFGKPEPRPALPPIIDISENDKTAASEN